MNINELLEALLGTNESFESALGTVQKVDANQLLTSLLHRLDVEERLDNSERERRFTSVFIRTSPQFVDLAALGEVGATITNSVLRNALAQLLPPTHRGLIFRSQEGRRVDSSESHISSDAVLRTEDEFAFQGLPTDREHTPFSDVIVLSITDDPASKKLLESAKFVRHRCASMDQLDEMLAINEEICAFVVESSFLASLNCDQQRVLVDKLASFSTFAWLRFQHDNLLDDNPIVSDRIARARLTCSPFLVQS